MAEYFNKFSGYFTLAITVIGFLIGAVIKLVSMKKDVMRKMEKAMGKGKLMELLLKLDNLSDKVPMDKLESALDNFSLECGIADMAKSIGEILSMKRTLQQPSVKEVLDEYKKEHDYGVIASKKRWNELRKDPKINQALTALKDHLVQKYLDQAETTKRKANVDQIKKLIDSITSDDNIMRNRKNRKRIEAYTEELRSQEKEVDLKKVQEKLFDIFKRK